MGTSASLEAAAFLGDMNQFFISQTAGNFLPSSALEIPRNGNNPTTKSCHKPARC